MTSLLQPAYALTLGSERYTEQALSLSLRLDAAPLIDVLTVQFPAGVKLGAATGDPVSLSLDGGEGATDAFTGAIDSIRRGTELVTVTALDAGGVLAAYRPAATYENATAATLVRTLCADVGVDVGDLEDGPTLAYYAADPGRSALEHVARLATWSGALASVGADGRLGIAVVNGSQPDVALRYGRELLAIEGLEASAPIAAFVVAGEAGTGDSSAPEALRPTTDFFGGNRPDGPDAAHVWRWEPALRTAAAAQTASASLTRLYAAGRGGGSLEAWLQPKLRPGTVLDIQDLPDGIPVGPFWLDRVSHLLSPHVSSTRARLRRGGDAFDPSALLGSLAAAVGL